MNKIAVISYHTCPLSDEKSADIGGMNTYVLELSRALTEKGYKIDIYTRSVDNSSCFIVAVTPNLRVIHIQAGPAVSVSKKKLVSYTPEFIQNIYKLIKEEKLSYDLTSAHYYLSGLIGLKLKNKLNIPLITTFHTLALMKNLVARFDSERADLHRIKAEINLVKLSDKVIATSENDFEYLHTLYSCPKQKICLLSPGVNLQLFQPIDKNQAKSIIKANLNEKILLFVGRLAPLKGIDVLLYAMKILLQKVNLPISLWIVGENISSPEKWSAELRRLQKISLFLGLSERVKFVGQKKAEELLYYYNAAEAVILPSWYESFGIVALEAMACGVPVITSDVTGVSGLLDETHSHLLTSASNPIGLAEKITNLLTDKNKYQITKQEVFQKVQDLGWHQVAAKFSKIIQNLKP